MELFARSKAMPITTFEPGFEKLSREYAEHLNEVGGGAPGSIWLHFLRLVGVLHHAGIPVVAGTDVGVPAHSVHRDLALSVRPCLTPMEAHHDVSTLSPRRVRLTKD